MLKLPKLLSDGCVLQRGDACRIWGWCDPGKPVSVAIFAAASHGADKQGNADDGIWSGPSQEEPETAALCEAQTVADKSGAFQVQICTPEPGGPYLLQVKCGNEERKVRDVRVGDVFICAGQSNMELPMERVRVGFPEEFHLPQHPEECPDVFLYKVEECFDFHGCRSDHGNAEWYRCTDRLPIVSAFSYFFGKALNARYKVPVGIINLSLGGTPAEAWMSREGLADWPRLLEQADIHREDAYCKNLLAQKAQEEADWYREIERQEAESADAPFHPAHFPGELRDWGLEDFCGCLWLRKTFEVSAAWEELDMDKVDVRVNLGTLVDSDTVYINGIPVGETPYRYPPRSYAIPRGTLHKGTNEIRIRLICREGDGRVTNNKPLCIRTGLGPMGLEGEGPLPPILLDGDWEYQVRAKCGHAPEQVFLNRVPTGLFQGMVAPCLPYAVKGAIWYQGESNDRSPAEYEAILKGLIFDWRRNWKQHTLPFVVVQLPNCDVDIAPGDAWAQIREAQRRAMFLSDTMVTVNLDAGEDNDLHPIDKKTVAERAAEAVRAVAYRETVCCRGPQLDGWTPHGRELHLEFQSGGGDLVLKKCAKRCSVKENPRLFEVAGADRIYHPAAAEIRGKTIILQSDEVENPYHARYAWDRAPGMLLLYDEQGNCASPFRTE